MNKIAVPQASELMKFVYIIDDDVLIRRSVNIWLSAKNIVPRSFAGPIDFVEAMPDLEPGCLLLDVRMPDLDGISMIEKYQDNLRRFIVIMITGHGDLPMAVKAMKAGAFDFIEKPFDSNELLKCIEDAFDQLFIQLDRVNKRDKADQIINTLSDRETEVLEGLCSGLSTKAIARGLDLSPRTIEMHRGNLMKKLGVQSLSEAVKIALTSRIGDGRTQKPIKR